MDKSNDFAQTLVKATTGNDLNEIPTSERALILAKCLNLLKDFVFNYIQQNYGQKDLLRLKSAYLGNDEKNCFSKNPDLKVKFDEAFQAYLDNLKETWRK